MSASIYVEGDKWKVTKAETYEWKGKKHLKVSEPSPFFFTVLSSACSIP